MTDKLREAAQQALEVLDRAGSALGWQAIGQVERELRAALAEQPAEQEPVADEPNAQHRHEWFRTGAMEPGQMRCITCGIWGREAPQLVRAAALEEFVAATVDLGYVSQAYADDFAATIRQLKDKT